jgi:MoxR-like ATPase
MSDVAAVNNFAEKVSDLKKEIGNVIIGQNDIVEKVLISIFSNGHCLLIGVPGLAKTLLVSTVAKVFDMSYNRIQFTPDLMPSDIVGSEILDESKNFKFNKGPIFSNIILADEINRTPPKTQSALLEAMQEKSVTVAGTSYNLPNPFFVLATQNPIEQEGTYPLPEAQLDRFMFNVFLEYPTFEEEVQVVKNTTSEKILSVNKIMTKDEILMYQQLVRKIPVADNVLEYAVGLSNRTRPNSEKSTDLINKYISWGAGPRASQFLVLGAKCHAAMKGKFSPDIEDVQAVAHPILAHRIFRNYKAEAEGMSVKKIVDSIL